MSYPLRTPSSPLVTGTHFANHKIDNARVAVLCLTPYGPNLVLSVLTGFQFANHKIDNAIVAVPCLSPYGPQLVL